MTIDDGVAWLIALAERYEDTAASIRSTAALIREAEAAAVAQREHETSGDGPVRISEAIRRALAHAGRPLKPREIWETIKSTRIVLATKSTDPRKMIDSTLTAMERSRQVKRVDGGW